MLKRLFIASTLLSFSLLALVLLATPPSVRAELAGEAVPPGNVSPAILRTCQRITGQSLLRIQGDFGHFQGYVSQAGPGGLDGLRAHPTEGSAPPPPGLVTWDRIDRIERRVGSSGWGALVGAVIFGGLGAYFGPFLAGGPDANPSDEGGARAAGAGIGGAVGAGLGALVGTAIPRWHVDYEAVRLPGVPPTITAITPLSQTVTAGSNAAITASATGPGPLAYRWFRNGLPLTEPKSPTLSFAPAQPIDSGAYFCVVTNGFGAATSAVAMLSVTTTEK